MHVLRFICMAVLLLQVIVHASPTTAAKDELKLVFGLYTTDKPTVLVKAFRPMLSAIESDLSDALNKSVSIRMHISPSYESGIAALVNGEVDFSRFGPASYVAAHEQNPDLQILALDSKNGAQTFKGVIAVHEDSKIADIADLKGTRFAFGNEGSTIGRYLSQAYLLRHGVTSSDLGTMEYLKRHDLVGHAVANRSFDAGALKESTFKKLRKKGLPLKALATFDNVNKPWIARSGLSNELVAALRKAMFDLSSPEAFKALGRKQFVAGTDADFKDVRDAINNNARFFQEANSLNATASDVQ